jgi:hypothetical protein
MHVPRRNVRAQRVRQQESPQPRNRISSKELLYHPYRFTTLSGWLIADGLALYYARQSGLLAEGIREWDEQYNY